MNLQSWHHSMMTGKGWISRFFRAITTPVSLAYGLLIRFRNVRYNRNPKRTQHVPVPVISIGNITTGGTGKTPLVIYILHWLTNSGRHPAVVSRGYKAEPGQEADELRLIWHHAPDTICVANPNRVAGAIDAIEHQQANAVVLDDGFQHRRIARDLDIVVIDSTCPFGHGSVLPKGLLREPLDSLSRADLIILSRVDQTNDSNAIEATIARYAPEIPILRCVHKSTGMFDATGTAHHAPHGKAFAFAAIGNPESFRKTLIKEGVDLVGTHWLPDHHAYSKTDLFSLIHTARNTGASFLVTTEKDIVKLTDFVSEAELPVLALRIEIEFKGDGASRLGQILSQTLQRSDFSEPLDTPSTQRE